MSNLKDQFDALFSIITPPKQPSPPPPTPQPTQPQQQTLQPPQQQQLQQPLAPILPTPSPQGAIPPSTSQPPTQPSIAASSQKVASKTISPDDLSEEDYNVKINSSIEYDGNQETKNYLAGIDENGNVYYKEEKSV